MRVSSDEGGGGVERVVGMVGRWDGDGFTEKREVLLR